MRQDIDISNLAYPVGRIPWRRFRAVLMTVHLWAGLILAIPFILLGISGSILVLQPEAPRWSIPAATATGEIKSAEAILAAAEAVVPAGMRADRVLMPQRSREPASIRFQPIDRRERNADLTGPNTIYVDPVSLEVLGTGVQGRPAAIFGIMRTLHATLYVRTISDRSFVGWLGIAMTLLSLSGLVLWWPREGQWKRAFLIKRGARGFRLNHDLHAAFGIWTLLLFLVISISGVYLAFPRSFRAAVGLVLSIGYNFEDPSAEAANQLPLPQPLSLDQAIATAQAAVPGIVPLNFQLPNRPDSPYVLNFRPTALGQGAPPILVSVDRMNGQIVYVDDFRTYNVGEQVVVWQRLLHSGLGLGIAYKILVFLSGFLPLLFGITGFRMWWLKRSQRRVTAPEMAGSPAE